MKNYSDHKYVMITEALRSGQRTLRELMAICGIKSHPAAVQKLNILRAYGLVLKVNSRKNAVYMLNPNRNTGNAEILAALQRARTAKVINQLRLGRSLWQCRFYFRGLA